MPPSFSYLDLGIIAVAITLVVSLLALTTVSWLGAAQALEDYKKNPISHKDDEKTFLGGMAFVVIFPLLAIIVALVAAILVMVL